MWILKNLTWIFEFWSRNFKWTALEAQKSLSVQILFTESAHVKFSKAGIDFYVKFFHFGLKTPSKQIAITDSVHFQVLHNYESKSKNESN